jgi:glycosyltransferase involved in cell wall biosynthesis
VPLSVDYAGPGELVQPEWGYKVPCGTRKEIVARFGTALADVVSDPSTLPRMSKGARARVESHFLWARKAQQVAQVYAWILDGKATPAPEFF